jgi:PAS domain S-box-containing protein/putative nucleotidyltransferase with HDIG domain
LEKKFTFAKKKNKESQTNETSQTPWKILVVDDDESIHVVTELVLDDFTFEGRPLSILDAYSASEAARILAENEDIAMAFLDVVMENDTAGLQLVHFIRDELKNHDIRIVLRTGQPGAAPENEIISTYDIDDYKDKTELTNVKLKTTVHNAIKSYARIMTLKENASKLEKYKNMFDSATDFIFIVDKHHRIVEANKALLKAIGKERDEIIDKTVFEVFYNSERHEDIENGIEQSMLGENISYESQMEFDSLGKRFIDVKFFPYYDKGRSLSAAVVNFKDITNDVEQRDIVSSLKNSQIENYEQTITSLVDTIEQRDSFTAGHTRRVANYCRKIAIQMNVEDSEVESLYKAAMLHDIGKISTPDAILLKPGKFNVMEYDLIKSHLDVGYELLKKVDTYKGLAEIMLYHHERYDGKGYPQGLKGDEIPLLGHIMCVADSFDAMTTNRIYKKRKEIDVAFEEMLSLRGTQFHPDVVDAAVVALKDVEVELGDQLPTTKMEKARFAYFFVDNLTKAYNKDYLKIALSLHKEEYQSINYLELHNMSAYNSIHGWEKGDELLRYVADYLQGSLQNSSIFRVHGDDFVILCRDAEAIGVDKLNYLPLIADDCVNATLKSLSLEGMESIEAENFEEYFKRK